MTKRVSQQGAALIEFSFVLLPLLLLTFGVLLYGLVFVSQQAFAFAAQRGADAIVQVDPESSAVMVDGSFSLSQYCATGQGQAVARVQSVLPSVGLFDAPSVASAATSGPGQAGCRVTVTKDFPLNIPLLPLPSTLRGVGFVPVS